MKKNIAASLQGSFFIPVLDLFPEYQIYTLSNLVKNSKPLNPKPPLKISSIPAAYIKEHLFHQTSNFPTVLPLPINLSQKVAARISLTEKSIIREPKITSSSSHYLLFIL